MEEQAIDRVHRLNQKVDVVVYKMTIKDSVEERILDLQNAKRELANATIEGKAVGKLGLKEMLQLFKHGEHHDENLNQGPGMTKTRILPKGGAALSAKPEWQQGTLTQGQQSRQSSQVRENPVYGRRW